ncbi:MAG TPA: FAD-dependent oxidoreductase [Gammaproteobacteria bacterium]|nr:FAD-dependent oxidoreductase [Gammaproteobacteria bacterium]
MDDVSLKSRGFSFGQLRTPDGLVQLDRTFREGLGDADPELAARLQGWRSGEYRPEPVERSAFLLELAPHLESFVTDLFAIGGEVERMREAALADRTVMRFKEQFVQRLARKYRGDPEASLELLDDWLMQAAGCAGAPPAEQELAVARFGLGLLADRAAHRDEIDRLTQWCVHVRRGEAGPRRVARWPSFRLPQKLDHANLVPLEPVADDPAGRYQGRPEDQRRRDGFELTDARFSRREVQSEISYCIYCHDHDGDFCSKGFPEKKAKPELGYKVDPLGVTLTGCPLEEKISEMHVLKRDGRPIAALAMIMIDNPMVPATGHRICNDCMKACIYQKQDPVNIPQVETGVLTDVLDLPWGVEIYDLLTRWNPLRAEQYLQRPYNGRKVLIAGMGPAGFTMAHHLTMEGCAVVGIDGLKIEPLPEELLERPVRDWSELVESLDERILMGFGGVAEYGITVRWDKNFLKLIYLTLARRSTFQVFGGVRFGGTLTLETAWELGFDHVCVATGAGLPRVIPMGNSLARGMRQANDFLMALQLTGAGKATSIASLQVRLPAVVIGGGLTGIDTATEVQAYYIKQVEKVLRRHERLVEARGEEAARAGLGEEDRCILDQFLEHGRAVRAERERAARAGEKPDFGSLLRRWGGVTIAYRKGLNASPAYTRNHEEVINAMQEGLYYAEGLNPLRAELDEYGHVRRVMFRRMKKEQGRWLGTAEELTLPARSVFVAAGTVPNTIYEREHPGHFELEADHFLPHVEHSNGLQPVQVPEHCKQDEFGPFTSYQQDGRMVSFVGDTHPAFQGSVVKAITSSARTYPKVMASLRHLPEPDASWADYGAFATRMEDLLTPRVISVNRDNPAMVELWVRAPLAARSFRAGQFFRLQTFEAFSPVVEGTRLQVPLLTVSGTGVQDDMVRLLVLQWGSAPRLVGRLSPGDPVVLMGPTGAPTEIPRNRTVMIVAGRWGAAVMLDIGKALREAGNRVLYVAAFGSPGDVDHQEELEDSADQIVWCTASAETIRARRPGDVSLQATDMVEVVRRYGDGELGPEAGGTRLADVSRVMIMGGTGLLSGFQKALEDGLQARFAPDVQAVGTVGSPMQCMLKGVCSQCLQWQIDPETGQRTRAVFSCAEQDQPLAWIDLANLSARQQQNRLSDRQTALWVDHLLRRGVADGTRPGA